MYIRRYLERAYGKGRWRKLKGRTQIVNEAIKEKGLKLNVDLKVNFQLSGAPPLSVELNKDSIRISDDNLNNANITLTGDLSMFYILRFKKNRKRNLMKALLLRRLKIRGNLLNIFRLYRVFWVFEELFSTRIS